MSTFGDVSTRITGDYLNRPGFAPETKRAIQAAIRHYQYRRWTFNETATAISTVSSVSFTAVPSNFLVLDDLRLTYQGETTSLKRKSPDWIRDANTVPVFGPPTHFSIYQNKFNFFQIPDSAYACPMTYLKSLDTLSADADTNAWIQGGMEDVIAYHATKLMWSNVLRKDAEALKYAILEKQALDTMNEHKEQYLLTSLRPTAF